MLRLAAIAVIGAVSAAASAEAVIALTRDHPNPPLRQAEAAAAPAPAPSDAAPATGQAAWIDKSEDGHYWAEAAVNGEEVRFLVDTGASAVALTPEDAQRLGFDPSNLNYAFTVNTASGQARAAEVNLSSVMVAGAEVDNVQAYVIESGLKTSLLGMTYLGRLSQFEATKTSLILRP